MSYTEKPRSNLWFLLPIFFGVIGGIIAFFILWRDDPRKAKNCLYLGLAFMFVGIILNGLISYSIPDAMPGTDIGFNVNT